MELESQHDRAVRRFNRICAVISLVFAIGIVLASTVTRRNYYDFPQFYMGGVIASSGAWDDLYPIPTNALHNPGEPDDSIMRPRYTELARRRGVGDSFRFIQLPFVAVVLAPLSLLSLPSAHAVWLTVMAICAWNVSILAGRSYEILAGQPSRMRGIVTFTFGCSLLVFRSVRHGNMSALVALGISLAVLWLCEKRSFAADRHFATGVVVSSLSKYAGVVLLPIAAALGRWRAIVLSILVAVALIGVTLPCSGIGPYRTFMTEIVPTLGRSFGQSGNQSIQGFLFRLEGVEELTAFSAIAIHAVRWSVLIAVLALIVLRRVDRSLFQPICVLASSAALVGWLLLFSPICWTHYYLYTGVFWGWLGWEITLGGWRRWMSAVAIILLWAPLSGVPWIHIPSRLDAYEMFGQIVMLVVAVSRLGVGAEPVTDRFT